MANVFIAGEIDLPNPERSEWTRVDAFVAAGQELTVSTQAVIVNLRDVIRCDDGSQG